MTLITLIYGSSAVEPFSEADLVTLLAKSRENNHRLGVTGILLYQDGNFLQVLEGEDTTVAALYQTISADPRHRGILTFMKRPIPQREFSDWEMGFVNLDTTDAEQIPGYSPYLNLPLNAPEFQKEGFAATFIRVFKQMMTR